MKQDRIKEIDSKFQTSWKTGAELVKATDPFDGLINIWSILNDLAEENGKFEREGGRSPDDLGVACKTSHTA